MYRRAYPLLTTAPNTMPWSLEAWTRSFEYGTPSSQCMCSKQSYLVKISILTELLTCYKFYCRKPISSLFGQGSPVFAVSVESSRDRIYSVGSDNTVKVSHLKSIMCVCTL